MRLIKIKVSILPENKHVDQRIGKQNKQNNINKFRMMNAIRSWRDQYI